MLTIFVDSQQYLLAHLPAWHGQQLHGGLMLFVIGVTLSLELRYYRYRFLSAIVFEDCL